MKLVEVDKNGFGFIPEGPLKQGIYVFASIQELRDLWVAAQMRTLEIGRMAIREESGLPNTESYPDFKTHLTHKGINITENGK